MTLRKHDLLRCGPERMSRVLWVDPAGRHVAVIDLSPVHWPTLLLLAEVMEDLSNKRCSLADDDVVWDYRTEDKIPASERARRDEAWGTIKDIVTSEPDVYVRLRRARMITEAVSRTSATRPTVESRLRRYWLRGMTKNALLPDFRKCGAPGVSREPGSAKRGRPREDGLLGVNVTPEIKAIFKIGIVRFRLTDRFTLQGAYDKMIGDYFADKVVNPETGRVELVPKEPYKETGFPTVEQFRYAVLKDNMLNVMRQRMTPRVYDRTYRGLTDTSAAHTWGPGARFQIDATLADVYIVSRLDRCEIVGRPVLYLVIDVFSRMIVGVYVGIENACWVCAMMALANAAAPKVEYCRRFGVEIGPETWPVHHLPATLLGDRGEMESGKVDHLQNAFNVTVENAAPYEAAWKAVVEKRFHLLPAKFGPYVPGYVRRDYRARGGNDYRLDAALDIDDFTAIIIELILYHNNHHELKGYDREPGMTADGVPSIPIDLFNWGVANRSGLLRSFPPHQVRFALLPVERGASVTPEGVRFRGRMYASPYAVQRRWFERARRDGIWKVDLSYDPRDADVVYVHVPERPGYVVFEATSRGRDAKGASLWEVEAQRASEKLISGAHRLDRQTALAAANDAIERRVEKALARQPGVASSHAARVRGIRVNRQETRERTRAVEGREFRPSDGTVEPAGTTDPCPEPIENHAYGYAAIGVERLKMLKGNRG